MQNAQSLFLSRLGPALPPALTWAVQWGRRNKGKKEGPFPNGGRLESPLGRLKCWGEMSSGEGATSGSLLGSSLVRPLHNDNSPLKWCILPREHWCIYSSGLAHIMIVTSPLSNKVYFFRLPSPCMAYGGDLVLAFQSAWRKGMLLALGQLSSISSHLPPTCLQPGRHTQKVTAAPVSCSGRVIRFFHFKSPFPWFSMVSDYFPFPVFSLCSAL